MNRQHDTIGPNEVVVPEAFFKVVLCLVGKPKAFGFIVRNNEGLKKRDLYYNSVDDIERITGLDFFPALPDDVEKEVEAKVDMDEWR
jgi:endonuclease G